jgi:hypothetical protein
MNGGAENAKKAPADLARVTPKLKKTPMQYNVVPQV